jgi:TolA-binding protein/TM2 domain-containing membrane protein YozV
MKYPAIVLIALTLLCCPVANAAEMSAEKMLSFGDSLFERGDYYRAITEYERVIFFYPDHALAKTARFQIANSYLKGDRIDQAIERFKALSMDLPNEDIGRKAFFMLGEAYYQKREYARAVDFYESYIETYPGDERIDAARIRIGWCYLRQGKWRQASEEFGRLPPDSPLHAQAAGLAEGAQAYPGIPTKSPTLAGGLSAVLPGAGQLYVNRPGDALVSFLLNGAFIWATVEAFHNDNNVTGGILLFFESGWYLGNIYNAVNGAEKYNRRNEQKYLDGLQDKYHVSYRYDGKGGNMVAFTVRF